MKYIFIKNGKLDGAGECIIVNDEITNCSVSEKLYEDYCKNPSKYIYSKGEIVEDPKFADIEAQNKLNKEIETLELQLKELDDKRIRAVCENSTKNESTGETWLDYYNQQIKEAREQLQLLKSQL
ncbi:hypothetical protein HDR58_10455 [bacterium]|nr:hypothetical protein [bacterium]